MFATPSGLGARRPGDSRSRRLFGHVGRHSNASADESNLDQESPVPEVGDATRDDDESGEMLRILRNLQQQVSTLQAQQAAQEAAPPVAESPAASTSSKKLPKDLTVSHQCAIFVHALAINFTVFGAANC